MRILILAALARWVRTLAIFATTPSDNLTAALPAAFGDEGPDELNRALSRLNGAVFVVTAKSRAAYSRAFVRRGLGVDEVRYVALPAVDGRKELTPHVMDELIANGTLNSTWVHDERSDERCIKRTNSACPFSLTRAAVALSHLRALIGLCNQVVIKAGTRPRLNLSRALTRATFATAGAHRAFLASNFSVAVILEDDVAIGGQGSNWPYGSSPPRRIIGEALLSAPNAWQMLWLGYCYEKCQPARNFFAPKGSRSIFFASSSPKCLHGVATSREGSRNLVDGITATPINDAVDNLVANLITDRRIDRSFSLWPRILNQQRRSMPSLNWKPGSANTKNPPPLPAFKYHERKRCFDGVIREEPRARILWEHVHMPKTGGTSVADALSRLLCGPTRRPLLDGNTWDARGSRGCVDAILDTEFSWPAMTGYRQLPSYLENRDEHCALSRTRSRANVLLFEMELALTQRRKWPKNWMASDASVWGTLQNVGGAPRPVNSRRVLPSPAPSPTRRPHHSHRADGTPPRLAPNAVPSLRIMYVTTLRSGTDRAISHWAHCMEEMGGGSGQPNGGRCTLGNIALPALGAVSRWSDESLVLFLRLGASKGQLLRVNNLQVATLASTMTPIKRLDGTALAAAKRALGSSNSPGESWIIGFTECLRPFYRRIAQSAGIWSDESIPTDVHEHELAQLKQIRLEARYNRHVGSVNSSGSGWQLATRLNDLDNEFHAWARSEAQHGRPHFVDCAADSVSR